MLSNHHKPFIFFLVLLIVSFAFADDNKSEGDVIVTLDVPVVSDISDKTPIEQVGDNLYDAQEGAHNTITQTTGEKVDHYYVHLCLGKKACIPVDPFRFSN